MKRRQLECKLGGLVVALVGVLARPTSASAQNRAATLPATVLVEAVDCANAPISMATTAAQLSIELRAMGIAIVSAPAPSVVRIRLELTECARSARTVRVSTDSGAEHPTPPVDVAIPADARHERERIVALSIAELLRDAWSTPPAQAENWHERYEALEQEMSVTRARETQRVNELAAQLEEAQAASARDHETTTALRNELAALHGRVNEHTRFVERAVAERAPLRTQIFVLGSAIAFLDGQASLFGARGGVDLPIGAWRLVLDASFGIGSTSIELAAIQLKSTFVSVSLLAPFSLGPIAGAVGGTVRGGWTHANAQPYDTVMYAGAAIDSGSGALGGRAMLSIRVSDRLRVLFDLGAGYEIFGVDATFEHRRVVALHGAWLEASFGIAYGL